MHEYYAFMLRKESEHRRFPLYNILERSDYRDRNQISAGLGLGLKIDYKEEWEIGNTSPHSCHPSNSTPEKDEWVNFTICRLYLNYTSINLTFRKDFVGIHIQHTQHRYVCVCAYICTHIFYLPECFSHLVSFHCFLAFTVFEEKLTFVLNIVFLYVMSFFSLSVLWRFSLYFLATWL